MQPGLAFLSLSHKGFCVFFLLLLWNADINCRPLKLCDVYDTVQDIVFVVTFRAMLCCGVRSSSDTDTDIFDVYNRVLVVCINTDTTTVI